jgi:hypothetical protein
MYRLVSSGSILLFRKYFGYRADEIIKVISKAIQYITDPKGPLVPGSWSA